MSEQPQSVEVTPIQRDQRPPAGSGGTMTALIIYILYLVPYFAYLPMIVGVVIAYTSRADSDPLLTAHYDFQIRTFWISLLYLAIVLILFPLAALLGPLLVIWLIVRCVRGIVSLQRGEPPQKPETWLY